MEAELLIPMSVKQQEGIPLLIQGYTQSEVARRLDISQSAVCQWMKRPDLREFIEDQRAHLLEGGQLALDLLAQPAIATIRDVMLDESQSGATRLKAAAMVLDRVGLVSQGSNERTEIDLPELAEWMAEVMAQAGPKE